MIRDLTTGSVIRQHRETTASGEFVKRSTRGRGGRGDRTMKSAFDNEEPYTLTGLGKEFVHYTMQEIVPKIGGSSAGGTNPQ
jgi:hypothetical protein